MIAIVYIVAWIVFAAFFLRMPGSLIDDFVYHDPVSLIIKILAVIGLWPAALLVWLGDYLGKRFFKAG